MRSILLATVITSLSLGGCAPAPKPEYKEVRENFWTHMKSPTGENLVPAETVNWAVDAASCGERLAQVEKGMYAAGSFWGNHSGLEIKRAVANEPINFVVYCAPFGTDRAWTKKSFALREMTIDSQNVITKMSVEFPSDWDIVEDRVAVPYSPKAYSTYGAAYNVVGMALGVFSVMEDGRSHLAPKVTGYFDVLRCVNNCDT